MQALGCFIEELIGTCPFFLVFFLFFLLFSHRFLFRWAGWPLKVAGKEIKRLDIKKQDVCNLEADLCICCFFFVFVVCKCNMCSSSTLRHLKCYQCTEALCLLILVMQARSLLVHMEIQWVNTGLDNSLLFKLLCKFSPEALTVQTTPKPLITMEICAVPITPVALKRT